MTTNEHTIIDGVDVSGCSGFSNNPEDVKTGQTCWFYTEYVHGNEWGTRCPEHPDCYYKQLQRKTAECENSKKRISDLEDRIMHHAETVENYCSRLADKQKECEKLQKLCQNRAKTINDLVGCVSLWEEFSEEESELAKNSSIADLVVLLREARSSF